LDDLLEKHRVCFLTAPALTGKTAISYLLSRHLQAKEHTFIKYDTTGRFKEEPWKEWSKVSKPTTVVIDEVQYWYQESSKQEFWELVQRQMEKENNNNPNLRLLLLGSHGEGVPVSFEEERKLDTRFCYFTKEEFEEFLASYNRNEEVPIQISKCKLYFCYITSGSCG
jgi:hypothetical protein